MSRRIGVPEVKKVSVKKVPMMKASPMGMMNAPSVKINKAGAGPELDEKLIKPVQGLSGERISGSRINTPSYHGLDVNAHMRMK